MKFKRKWIWVFSEMRDDGRQENQPISKTPLITNILSLSLLSPFLSAFQPFNRNGKQFFWVREKKWSACKQQLSRCCT